MQIVYRKNNGCGTDNIVINVYDVMFRKVKPDVCEFGFIDGEDIKTFDAFVNEHNLKHKFNWISEESGCFTVNENSSYFEII